MKIEDFITDYLEEEKRILSNFPFKTFKKIVTILQQIYEKENHIFVFGNGGSGSTSSHFSGDMNKGVSFNLTKKFKVTCLNDNIPLILAYSNDTSFENIFIEQLKNFVTNDDVVIAISGSGNSKNVIKAVKYANERHITSIALTGFDGGELVKIADVSVIVPSKDMQKIEDMHMIILHMIMQFFFKNLKGH